MNDDAHYQAALDRFYLEPEAISDADIELMSKVDDALATKASTRRGDALRQCAEARHRAATGQPPPKQSREEIFAELVSVSLIHALARPRQRIKS
jgi:hypothetical protein